MSVPYPAAEGAVVRIRTGNVSVIAYERRGQILFFQPLPLFFLRMVPVFILGDREMFLFFCFFVSLGSLRQARSCNLQHLSQTP